MNRLEMYSNLFSTALLFVQSGPLNHPSISDGGNKNSKSLGEVAQVVEKFEGLDATQPNYPNSFIYTVCAEKPGAENGKCDDKTDTPLSGAPMALETGLSDGTIVESIGFSRGPNGHLKLTYPNGTPDGGIPWMVLSQPEFINIKMPDGAVIHACLSLEHALPQGRLPEASGIVVYLDAAWSGQACKNSNGDAS